MNNNAKINFILVITLFYVLSKFPRTSSNDIASNLLFIQILNGSLLKLDLENSGQIIWSSNASNTPLILFVDQKKTTDKHEARTNLILFLDSINIVYKYHQSKQELEPITVHSYQDENQEVFTESVQTLITVIDLGSGEILNKSYTYDQNFPPRLSDTIAIFGLERKTCIQNSDEICCYNQSAISNIKYFSFLKIKITKNKFYVKKRKSL